MQPSALELDVRPLVAARRPPMPEILQALTRLAPGQRLRLLAPFEPRPLLEFMAQRGFDHACTPLADGSWEVLFSPRAD